jgi:hypothetical protein
MKKAFGIQDSPVTVSKSSSSSSTKRFSHRRRKHWPMSCERDFLPLRVKSLPLATIYEVKIPLRKWKKSLLQRNPAQMTSAIDFQYVALPILILLQF